MPRPDTFSAIGARPEMGPGAHERHAKLSRSSSAIVRKNPGEWDSLRHDLVPYSLPQRTDRDQVRSSTKNRRRSVVVTIAPPAAPSHALRAGSRGYRRWVEIPSQRNLILERAKLRERCLNNRSLPSRARAGREHRRRERYRRAGDCFSILPIRFPSEICSY